MSEINLLPTQSPVTGENSKIIKTINKVTVFFGILFAMSLIFGAIFIIFLTTQINSSKINQDNLKQKIQALDATEQKLFLVRDRIEKVKIAQTDKNAEGYFRVVNQSLSSLPPTVSISSLEIDASKAKFSVASTDSLGMESFLNTLVVASFYKNLTLTNFTFSPGNGYLISLQTI